MEIRRSRGPRGGISGVCTRDGTGDNCNCNTRSIVPRRGGVKKGAGGVVVVNPLAPPSSSDRRPGKPSVSHGESGPRAPYASHVHFFRFTGFYRRCLPTGPDPGGGRVPPRKYSLGGGYTVYADITFLEKWGEGIETKKKKKTHYARRLLYYACP